ncbi:MAG: Holliday junction resolvase RuvX [Rubrivivax sp.]|nr:Holliday junction resolvase RuvX [Pyrinomonadaceae bacterium]
MEMNQPDSNQTDARPDSELGRLLALDLGARRVGVAVSDELRISIRTLPALARTNWKKFVRDVAQLCNRFDARGVVVGLPLNLDGSEGEASVEARRLARNLSLTLGLPAYLQDERLTSQAATEKLRAEKGSEDEISERVDSESAAIILRDFLIGGDSDAGKQAPA